MGTRALVVRFHTTTEDCRGRLHARRHVGVATHVTRCGSLKVTGVDGSRHVVAPHQVEDARPLPVVPTWAE